VLLTNTFSFACSVSERGDGIVFQAECEQEAQVREANHQKSLIKCREEMMRLVGVGDLSAVPVNEELIRKKYSQETRQIKVFSVPSSPTVFAIFMRLRP